MCEHILECIHLSWAIVLEKLLLLQLKKEISPTNLVCPQTKHLYSYIGRQGSVVKY